MKSSCPYCWLHCIRLAGWILLTGTPHGFANDNYDHACPICTEWDDSDKACVPITTPPYSIPLALCNHPINYVVYNSAMGAGGYILPNSPLLPPNNLFVTNRCHNGKMKYRIEGKFTLYQFSIYIVNRFLITSPNCNWPVNTERPRDSDYIEQTRTHELTHCNTLCTAINICNGRVINAGWFLSYATANAKRLEIIDQGNQTWTTAVGFTVGQKDVAGQPRSYISGACLTEIANGTWPY